jgi:hypothetical protein
MRLLIFLLFISHSAFAKAKSDEFIFTVKIMEYNQGRQATIPLEGAAVLVYLDSVNEVNLISKKVQTGSEPLKLSFPFDKNYQVAIEKQGYVTKWIAVSTKNIPAKRLKAPFAQFDMEMELFKKYPGIDYSIMDKPIAAISYNPEPDIDDFDYDRKHTLAVVGAVQNLKKLSLEKEVESDEFFVMYQTYIHLADSLYKAKEWSKAIGLYKAAATLKPAEKYPNERVALCERKSKEAKKPK